VSVLKVLVDSVYEKAASVDTLVPLKYIIPFEVNGPVVLVPPFATDNGVVKLI